MMVGRGLWRRGGGFNHREHRGHREEGMGEEKSKVSVGE